MKIIKMRYSIEPRDLPEDETEEEDGGITTHKKRYISPEERREIIDQLRLVPKKYV